MLRPMVVVAALAFICLAGLGGAYIGALIDGQPPSLRSSRRVPRAGRLQRYGSKVLQHHMDLRANTSWLGLLRAPSSGLGDRFGAWMNVFALAMLRRERVLLEWPDAWRRLPASIAADAVRGIGCLTLPPFVMLRRCEFASSRYDMVGGWRQLRAASIGECRQLCTLLGASRLANTSTAVVAAPKPVPVAQCHGLMYNTASRRCHLYHSKQPACIEAGAREHGRCADAPRGWIVLSHRCDLSGPRGGMPPPGALQGARIRLLDLRPAALRLSNHSGRGLGSQWGLGGGIGNRSKRGSSGVISSADRGAMGVNVLGGGAGVGGGELEAVRHRMGFPNVPHLMLLHWKVLT